jgi:hypothetical protein
MEFRRALLFASIILLFMGESIAQNTSSPYSRFGLGDLSSTSFGQFQALGGSYIGIRTPSHLNFNNSASFTSFDTLTFNYEFGAHGSMITRKTASLEQSKSGGNVSYIAAGFPITNWWAAGFALLPFSTVGYEIQNTSSFVDTYGETQLYQTYYSGSGGLNQVLINNAFMYKDVVSLGVNLKYLFGTIDNTRVINFIEDDGTTDSDYFTTKYSDKLIVSDFIYDLGLQIHPKLSDKYELTLGAIFSNSSDLNAFSNTYIEKQNIYGLLDTTVNSDSEAGIVKLPSKFGIGASFRTENWLIAADYETQNWSKATILGVSDSLANANRFSIGLEYVPNPRNITSYLARMRYRVGGHYSKSYLSLNGEQLKDLGISFGLGLPLRRTKSVINVSFELGKRGTTDFNLIEENYALIGLSLSLHDIWFVQRKFD